MVRRLSFLAPFALLAALVVLPACGKKASVPLLPGDPVTGSAKSDEFLAFMHINAKSVTASEPFTTIKKAYSSEMLRDAWAYMEKQVKLTLGTQLESLVSGTAYVTDLQVPAGPVFVAIMIVDKPLDKDAILETMRAGKNSPDERGLYRVDTLKQYLHFPDDKTAVLLHEDLAEKYSKGFGKDRSGWPASAELAQEAAGHTMYMRVQMDKLPASIRTTPGAEELVPLFDAKSASLSLDIKGNTFSAKARGQFADADTANKAKEKLLSFAQLAALTLAQSTSKELETGTFAPTIQEVKRAIKDVKIEANGTEVSVAMDYTLNIDFNALMLESTQKVREAAARMKSSNNLKQIGLALHNYESAMSFMPVHGVGKNLQVSKPNEKPLLSWRVAMLPYLEQEDGELFKQFKLDEPWDSENNKKLIEKMPKVFAVPGAKAAKPGHTFYQMVVGPNALPPGKITINSIVDGSSGTIAVVEAAEAVIWTKPDDVLVPGKDWPKDLGKKFGGHFKGGFNACMFDGSVRFLRDSVPETTLRALLTPAGGEAVTDY